MGPTLWSKSTQAASEAATAPVLAAACVQAGWLTNTLFHAFQVTAQARGGRRTPALGQGPRKEG